MSLKRKLLDDPPVSEQIFVNKHTYEAHRVYSVPWDEIHEYYNLVDLKFMHKIPSPFMIPTNPMVFKDLKDGRTHDLTDETFGPETILYKVDFCNEFFAKNGILLVLPDNALSEEEFEHYVAVNCYVNLVLRKCTHRTWDEISGSAPLDKTLHWVWFRKPGTKVDTSSALTWIEHNQDLSFVLWTDVDDEAELDEMLDGSLPKDRVQIRYRKDLLEQLDLPTDLARVVSDRVHERILIAKTDYVRGAILEKFGGFYADFNDCVCFCPLRYWFHEVPERDVIFPCDTLTGAHISNYFMYVKKGSKRFRDLHRARLAKFPSAYKYLMDPGVPEKIARLYVNLAEKFLRATKGHPVKELAKLMGPESSLVNSRIRDIVTPDGVPGFRFCDPRGRCFFPIYIFKYLGRTHEGAREFYEFMSDAFLRVMEIKPDGTINVDEEYDMEPLKDLGPSIKALESDQEFHTFLHTLFVKNMPFVVICMTNMTTGLKVNTRDLVPFCYAAFDLSMCSFIGHYGHGKSLGILD